MSVSVKDGRKFKLFTKMLLFVRIVKIFSMIHILDLWFYKGFVVSTVQSYLMKSLF